MKIAFTSIGNIKSFHETYHSWVYIALVRQAQHSTNIPLAIVIIMRPTITFFQYLFTRLVLKLVLNTNLLHQIYYLLNLCVNICNINLRIQFLIKILQEFLLCREIKSAVAHICHIFPNKLNSCLIFTNNSVTANSIYIFIYC